MEHTQKSVLEVRPEDWARFKALAARQGESVQALLGHLVTREVRRHERAEAQRLGRQKAARTAMDKALAEISAESKRRRTS